MAYTKDPDRYPSIFHKLSRACQGNIERIPLQCPTPAVANRTRNLWYAFIRAHEHEIKRLRDITFRTKSTDPAFSRITENNDLRIQQLDIALTALKRYQAKTSGSTLTIVRNDALEEFIDIDKQLDALLIEHKVPAARSETFLFEDLLPEQTSATVVDDNTAARVLGEFMSSHKPLLPQADEDGEESA